MNNNQERKKASATPWLLGAGALGLGGIGLALASKGKAKSGSVVKQTNKSYAVNVPKVQPQAKLGTAKPQASIKDELNQIKNQGQAKAKQADIQDELSKLRSQKLQPSIKDELDQIRGQGQAKAKQADIKDELDRMRMEGSKPANMKDELDKMRATATKPQPTIKEEVAALKNAEPVKTESQPQPKKPVDKSGVSGYSGLSKKDRQLKLEKRRRDLAEGLYDTDPNFDVNKNKDPELFRAANGWSKDPKTGKLKRNSALQRMEINSSTMLYGGSDSKRIKNNQKIKERNEAAIKRAKQIAKNTRGEYNAHIFLLCDL